MGTILLKQHVAFFIPVLVGGGAQRVVVNLSAAFAARGHKVDLVLARSGGVLDNDVDPSVRVIDLRNSRTMLAIPRLAKYLRDESPDVLMSTLNYANLAAIAARTVSRARTRLIVREANTLDGMTYRGGVRPYAMLRAMRVMYPWADHVIANSRATAADLQRLVNIPADSITVIANPVTTPEMLNTPLRTVHDEVRQPVVLSVGRLEAQKNFQSLIRAFAIYRGSSQKGKLVILGEGGMRDELTNLAADLGVAAYVELPGFVENPHSYYNEAAVFVSTARWEGFGNVIVEALAAGTPVVVSDCPGGPVDVVDGGRFGAIVPVGDDAAVANAIARAIGTTPDRPTLRARAAEFTVDRIAPLYESVLCYS